LSERRLRLRICSIISRGMITSSTQRRVIGQITLRWVYDVIMPREIIEEIRNRKRLSDKAHQWLSEGGLALLEKQIHAVTMIARSSMTYRDFDTRCATAFGSQPLQMTLFIGALEGGQ